MSTKSSKKNETEEAIGKSPQASKIVLSQIMGVTDSNSLGNVHGGIIMKLCDEAGGLAAARHAGRPTVTVNVDTMRFMSPVKIGSLMTVEAIVTWVGRTSIETKITVRAETVTTGEITHTNTAFFVYVALDREGRPTEVPPLHCETQEEKEAFERAKLRRNLRLQLAQQE